MKPDVDGDTDSSPTPPRVAVIVPVRDEPAELIHSMLSGLHHVHYPNFHVVFVDNSTHPLSSPSAHEHRHIALSIIRKNDTTGFKAGALNHALRHLDEATTYVLILDIDHVPRPEILNVLVPVLERRNDLAFAQAPQRFESAHSNVLSEAFAFQQLIFYDHVCPALSVLSTLFMTGTNTLIRTRDLREVGGFTESSLTEDLATTRSFHRNGRRGVYVDVTVATGLAPLNLSSYHRQQRRWAIGTFQNAAAAWRTLFASPTELRIGQWFHYLAWNGSWYLQGLVTAALSWSVLGFLLSDCRVDLTALFVLSAFLLFGSAGLQMVYCHRTTGTKYSRLFLAQSIFFGNAWTFVLAYCDFLCGRRLDFEVTDKDATTRCRPRLSFVVYHLAYSCTATAIVCWAALFGTGRPAWAFVWPMFFCLESCLVLALSFLDGKRECAVPGLRRIA